MVYWSIAMYFKRHQCVFNVFEYILLIFVGFISFMLDRFALVLGRLVYSNVFECIYNKFSMYLYVCIIYLNIFECA
jgi:hypothetical protein